MIRSLFTRTALAVLCLSLSLCACQAPPRTLFPAPDPAPNTKTVWNTDAVDLSCVAKDKKHVAFTFDDAPSHNLESIIAVFAAFNERNPDCPASATLFCNGARCKGQALETLKTAHLLGFELGNHNHTHANIATLSPQTLQSQIQQTDEILQTIDGNPCHLYRPPYGIITETLRTTVSVPIIHWSIDPLDWTGISATRIYDQIFSSLFDGAIILLHDGHPNTVEALKRLLPALKQIGYQALSVSALAKTNACTLRNGNVYIRARKNGKT